MRLFTAIQLPDEVASELSTWREPRADADDQLRWVPPHRWHLTTCFIADADTADDFSLALDQVAARFAPISLAFSGARALPNPASARVLTWPVINEEPVSRLARATRNAANRSGLHCDGKAFEPHLTLARTRRPHNVTKWLEVIAALATTEFVANEFVLVQSHAPSFAHEVLATFPLRGHQPTPR